MKMKFLIPILFLAATLWSCQSGERSTGHHDSHHEEHPTASSGEHPNGHDHSGMHDASLKLNNGMKWKTDAPTKRNAAHMKSITEEFQKGNPSSLAAFKKYGTDVKAGLDQMIKECTMTGAEDQALHEWFFPILENTGEIAKTDDTERAKELSHEIIERVHVYDQYFE